MSGDLIPVTAAPLADPGAGRIDLTLPEGLTLCDIVGQTFPGLAPDVHSHLRLTLVTPSGSMPVAQEHWHRVRPHAGVRVVMRLVPGKDTLRSVLSAVVAIASIATGQFWAAALIPTAGVGQTLLAGALAAGLSIVGNMLVNALIPTKRPDDVERRNVYAIQGWRNDTRPGEPVPYPLGRHRMAPPFAAGSWTEIVGDRQYVRALFCFGLGPLAISDLRLGETSLDAYEDVEIELREGRPGDEPVSLYPRQVIEQAEGVDLTRPYPVDDAGAPQTDQPAIETPVIRLGASDATEASVILGFPGGLFQIDGGGNVRAHEVSIRIRQRPASGGAWSEVATLDISSRTRDAIFRQHSWQLPSRGRWEFEITRMTPDDTDTRKSSRCVLSAVQSIRPEYPLNIEKPLALAALRIRATHQLNGQVDTFNALVERYADDWDGTEWVEGLSRNPATAYLAALRGPANPFPVPDSAIDWEGVAAWHEYCAAKGLKYDHPHESGQSLQDMLAGICGAGRAAPRHDGVRWGVVVDRPDLPVIDHVNPRNSADFRWRRGYFTPPEGFRVTFPDETNDHKQAERIVPWPYPAAKMAPAEVLELPGKTDPDEIWIEARRRMYELLHRPDSLSVVQDGAARVVTRGDLVMGSFDVLDRSQLAARVVAVEGRAIEIDENMEMEEGSDYAMRFRQLGEGDDSIGTSVVRRLVARPGSSRLVLLEGDGVTPAIGQIVHLGPRATESTALKVRGVEAGENFAGVIDMVPAAPEIDALTDAENPPAWDGRVGEVKLIAGDPPAMPRFVSVASGRAGTGDADALRLLFAPGTGAIVSAYRLEHRLQGASGWTVLDVPVAAAGITIDAYSSGDIVEMRLSAIGVGEVIGTATPILTVEIGSEDPAIPAAIPAAQIEVTGSLGHAGVTISTGADTATRKIQIYRVPAGDPLDREAHAAGEPFVSAPATTLAYVDGDGTRTNMLRNGGFDSDSAWTKGTGWLITGDAAEHGPGTASDLSQTLSLVAGTFYRIAYTVSDHTAGSVEARLTGGSAVNGTAVSATGPARDRLQASAGNTAFALHGDLDFEGAVDDVTLFAETATCIPAGSWDYYIEPQNVDGIAGPMTGPFTITIS